MNALERLKLYLVNISLRYHEAEVERLLQWLLDRQVRSGRAIEMAGFFKLESEDK